MFIFNLQLFANANTQVSYTGNGTSGHEYAVNPNLSPEMKEYYSKYLIKLAEANLVYQQFADQDSIPKNGGRIKEWRMFSPFPKATTPLTEGVTPNGVPVVVKKINKQLDEFGAYSTVSDLLELTSIDPVITEVTSLHAQSMARTLDTIVRNEYVAGAGNYLFAGSRSAIGSITSSDKIAVADIAKASAILARNNTPKINGSYIGIVHTDVAHDIKTNSDFISVAKYKDPEKIYQGEIGELYGVRFVETTEAPITKESGENKPALYHCIIIGKGAIKSIKLDGSGAEIIVKPKGSSGTEDPLNQRSTIGWKIPLFGAQVVIPEYIVDLVCASSFSDIAKTNVDVGDATTIDRRFPATRTGSVTNPTAYPAYTTGTDYNAGDAYTNATVDADIASTAAAAAAAAQGGGGGT